MPGIIGFPQLDPGLGGGGGSPPEPEEEPTPSLPPPMEEMEDLPATGLVTFVAPAPSTFTIAEQIRLRNQKRAEQDAAAHIEEPADISEPGRANHDSTPTPVVPDWHDTTPLTQLQAEQVNHLLAVETDSMAREALLGLKREGMPSDAYISDFMSQYAEWGWDDLSSALALQVLATVRNSDWNEMLGHADSSNDSVITFSLDDVRQFIGIDLATPTFDDADVAHYEKMLNKVFDYEIVFKVKYGYSPEEKIRQMQNLAKANVHIVDYFAFEAGLYFGVDEALEEFRKHFSRTDEGKLQVHLGDNAEIKGATFGLAPLPESATQKSILDTVFLGSRVDIPTIVHEFGHVIDRNINMTAYLEGKLGDGRFHLSKAHPTHGAILDEIILWWVIEGFVAKQFLVRELWADLFMTAVLSGMGFKVKSIEDEHIRTFVEFKYDLFECDNATNPGDAPCIDRDVVWEVHPIARAVREFLPKVFRHAMSARD